MLTAILVGSLLLSSIFSRHGPHGLVFVRGVEANATYRAFEEGTRILEPLSSQTSVRLHLLKLNRANQAGRKQPVLCIGFLREKVRSRALRGERVE